MRCGFVLEREFAVILLDVNMPDMDGFETATLIRGRRQSAHTPIIFVTALSDEMNTSQAYSLGAVDYILTPIVPEILRTKVGVFIDLYKKTQQVKKQAEEHVALARAQAAPTRPRRRIVVWRFYRKPARSWSIPSTTRRFHEDWQPKQFPSSGISAL